MLLEARTAIVNALNAANLPLSPTIEAVWKTTRQLVRGQTNALPETSPLVTVLPATAWGYRISKASHAYGAAIAIAVRANAPTEARCDALSDFTEDVLAAAATAVTSPGITEVMVAKWVDFELLQTSSIWASEIHVIIGQPIKGAA